MENKNIIRFEFTKKGGLKYISHLDLQRAVTRIIKRSHIPVRYTQGFNPHPKMVFGLPLSVGCESECEMLDVYMIMDESKPNVPLYTPDEFKAAILPNLPKGLDFVNAYYQDRSFNDINSATYCVEIDLENEDNITEGINNALTSPIIVFKKSKAGDREIDINPLIRSFKTTQKKDKLVLELVLSAEQNNYLNPELVISGLKKNTIINDAISFYSITRKNIIFNS